MRLIARSVAAGFALTLFCGCSTPLHKISVQQTSFPVAQPLPHHPVLVLDKELTDYQFKAGYVYPLGVAFQDYAHNVTGKCFNHVDEAASMDQAFADSSADMVLVPRVVKMDRSLGMYAWHNQNVTLVMEWVAKDRASQKTVWLKTITANASEPIGTIGTDANHRRILMQKLFDDLNAKTFEAFQHAPELRGAQL
jgi:hypothetical protein